MKNKKIPHSLDNSKMVERGKIDTPIHKYTTAYFSVLVQALQ
jgi:hypothetical protein